MIVFQGLLVLGFAVVHLVAGKLRFLDGVPRSRWLSMAGGVSVAYVFIHVFPELENAQSKIRNRSAIPISGYHAYLVALIGLIVFYWLERLVKSARQQGLTTTSEEDGTPVSPGIFWLHILSFAAYNALIGYLLVHREEQDIRGLLFFFVAMALHFFVTDYGLRQDHKAAYGKIGRWILVAAIFVGWGAGLATRINDATTGILFAFLAGGIILNVLKEELPEERQSRFSAFALGAAGYAILLLLL